MQSRRSSSGPSSRRPRASRPSSSGRVRLTRDARPASGARRRVGPARAAAHLDPARQRRCVALFGSLLGPRDAFISARARRFKTGGGLPLQVLYSAATIADDSYIVTSYLNGSLFPQRRTSAHTATVSAPSITRLAPDMRLAGLLDKNTTPAATSSAVPNLPVGFASSVDANSCGLPFSI